MNSVALYVHVPCATFRTSRSREYGKTYPVPPVSTVYGMLLSLVGETDSQRHCGVRLAIAMLSHPQKSRVLRKMRRFKEKDYGHKKNTTVEHQEILTDIKFIDGITFEDFQTDQKTIYAVTRAVVIISESVKSIPISSREQYPQVPWKSITGLGNKLIYHYFDVNLQVLWHTVQEELVILKTNYLRNSCSDN